MQCCQLQQRLLSSRQCFGQFTFCSHSKPNICKYHEPKAFHQFPWGKKRSLYYDTDGNSKARGTQIWVICAFSCTEICMELFPDRKVKAQSLEWCIRDLSCWGDLGEPCVQLWRTQGIVMVGNSSEKCKFRKNSLSHWILSSFLRQSCHINLLTNV